jgi:hypothetical protein
MKQAASAISGSPFLNKDTKGPASLKWYDMFHRACRTAANSQPIVRNLTLAKLEAQLELLRIRQFRAWLFEALYLADAALPDGLAELNESLAKLERYERRAFSRCKRARRAM